MRIPTIEDDFWPEARLYKVQGAATGNPRFTPVRIVARSRDEDQKCDLMIIYAQWSKRKQRWYYHVEEIWALEIALKYHCWSVDRKPLTDEQKKEIANGRDISNVI